MRKLILVAIILLSSQIAWAASSTSYNNSPEMLASAGGSSESSSYRNSASLVGNSSGTTSNSTYSLSLGFFGFSSTSSSSSSVDSTGPSISSLLFDGNTINSGDTVRPNVTITTTLSDESGIALETCSIEVDSSYIAFTALSGSSTYDATTGQLTYQPTSGFSDGNHSFKVVAQDSLGNSSEKSVTFAVNTAAPIIGDIEFNGDPIFSGDSVLANSVIEVLIEDSDGLNLQISSIEVDSTITYFANLSGSSTFDASSNILRYEHAANYSDGTHEFKVTAIDSLGNLASKSLSFRVNSQAPIISTILFNGVAITAGQTVSSEVTITTTISDETGLNLQDSFVEIDGDLFGFLTLTGDSTFDASSGTLTYKPTLPYSSGNHTFAIIAQDSLANMATRSISFTIDTQGPDIEQVKADGKDIVNNDFIAANASITAVITDTNGINTASSSIEIDSTIIAFKSLTGNSTFDVSSNTLTYSPITPFSSGSHSLTIYARDSVGNLTSGNLTFQVSDTQANNVNVFALPNPFNPNNGNLAIGYNLQKESNITIYIFNALGQLVYKRAISAGNNGAQVGYNEVSWDGQSVFGQVLSNDLYFLRLVAEGKVIGKGKIAILK